MVRVLFCFVFLKAEEIKMLNCCSWLLCLRYSLEAGVGLEEAQTVGHPEDSQGRASILTLQFSVTLSMPSVPLRMTQARSGKRCSYSFLYAGISIFRRKAFFSH